MSPEYEKIVNEMRDEPEGVDRRYTCPSCSHTRKGRNKNVKVLSVRKSNGSVFGLCHHCGEDFGVGIDGRKIQNTKPKGRTPMVEPLRAPYGKDHPNQGVGKELERLLKDRGISRETAEAFGVYQTNMWVGGSIQPSVAFPYFSTSGDLYAAKVRALSEKAYIQWGSCRTLFGSNLIDWKKPLTIVEGEWDVLACYEAGVRNVTSVPNGAVSRVVQGKVTATDDPKFIWMQNHAEGLESCEKIIIATDMDDPGMAIAEEISRRVGKARCWRVEWPAKDANALLLEQGPEAVLEASGGYKPVPINGLYDAKHFEGRLWDLYENGFAYGASTGYDAVDEIYTVAPGQITIVTGVPNSGKSEFIDQLMVNLARHNDMKFAIASFENPPHQHIGKLAQKYMMKRFFQKPDIGQRMTEDEVTKSLAWVNKHFSFVHSASDDMISLDEILDRLRASCLRTGIRGAVIDPYNFIARPESGGSETEFVNTLLSRLGQFARANDLHLWMVAHPSKLQPNADGSVTPPGGYNISGSANWFNKADHGLTIHRDAKNKPSIVEVHSWKSRHSWLGQQGMTVLSYHMDTYSYYDPNNFPQQ